MIKKAVLGLTARIQGAIIIDPRRVALLTVAWTGIPIRRFTVTINPASIIEALEI
jgi:hypothetical protein